MRTFKDFYILNVFSDAHGYWAKVTIGTGRRFWESETVFLTWQPKPDKAPTIADIAAKAREYIEKLNRIEAENDALKNLRGKRVKL